MQVLRSRECALEDDRRGSRRTWLNEFACRRVCWTRLRRSLNEYCPNENLILIALPATRMQPCSVLPAVMQKKFRATGGMAKFVIESAIPRFAAVKDETMLDVYVVIPGTKQR